MDTKRELRAALNYALQRIDNGVDVRQVAVDVQNAAAGVEAVGIRQWPHGPLTNWAQAIMTLQDALQSIRQSTNLRDELNEIIGYLVDIRDDETAKMHGTGTGYTEYDRLHAWAADLQRLADTVGDATVDADDLTQRLTDSAEVDTQFGVRTVPLALLIRACADRVDIESKRLKNRLEPARTA